MPAYGGVDIAASLLWPWLVEGVKPIDTPIAMQLRAPISCRLLVRSRSL